MAKRDKSSFTDETKRILFAKVPNKKYKTTEVCCLRITRFGKAKSKSDEAADQHDFLIVSLNGKTAEQFSELQEQFKEFIAALARKYCDEKGIHNYGEINSSTIEIHRVERCPTEWPESDLCTNINMSVPVNGSENYELNAKSLHSMWKTHSDDELRELGVKEYNIPSSSTILVLWVCVTGILFLVFCIILICAIKTRFVETYIRSRKDILGSSNRSWISQYGEKQLVPPFFYPEPPRTTLEEAHIKYDVEASLRKRSIGIENPAYVHDTRSRQGFTSQISQTTTTVDDFDSEDETIYPPAPLPRPILIRNGKRSNSLMKSETENETEL